MTSNTSIDFFISYTKNDEKWAEWIALQLEDMGYKVYFKKWDLLAGGNYVVEIDDAMANANQTIVVLSEEYLAAGDRFEWTVAFTDDRAGKKRKLLPIKVKPVNVAGKLESISAIDLINLPEEDAKQRLLNKIKASKYGKRSKPSTETSYPGPRSESIQTTQSQDQNTQPQNINKLEESYKFKAGLVDKEEQAKHIFKLVGNEFYINDTSRISQSAFILFGAESQWPHALIYILYYEIKKRHQFKNHNMSKKPSPEAVFLNGRVLGDSISPECHLWELLAETLLCAPEKKDIESKLGNEKAPHIIFRTLRVNESQNPALFCGMIEAWESLELSVHAPRHILILFYECSDNTRLVSLSRIFSCLHVSKTKYSLIEKIKNTLLEETKSSSKKDTEEWINCHFLPEITSPNKQDIKDWIESNFDSGKIQKVKDFVENKIKAEYKKRTIGKKASKERAARIRLTTNNIEIHHYDLKEILVHALEKFA